MIGKTIKRIGYGVVLLAVGLALAACEGARIGDINADPGKYMNKEVAVQGTVTNSIGALGRGIYQIDDGTGRIWVLTNGGGVPSKGAKVGVKGHITQSVTFLGTNYGTVLQETERKRS